MKLKTIRQQLVFGSIAASLLASASASSIPRRNAASIQHLAQELRLPHSQSLKHVSSAEDVCTESEALFDFILKEGGTELFNSSSRLNSVSIALEPSKNELVPVTDLLLYYSIATLLLETDGPYSLEEQSFGRNDEYTDELIYQHRLLMDFWNVSDEKNPVLFAGAQSEILEDRMYDAIVSWLVLGGHPYENVSEQQVSIAAEEMKRAIELELPNSYSNPVLSVGVAFFAPFPLRDGSVLSLILIGDGILDYSKYTGFGAIGSDIISAHEFSHYMQHILDLEDLDNNVERYFEDRPPQTTENTRRDELEADAMAAYALAHEKGRNLEVSLLVDASLLIYSLGDCSFESTEHHGTAKQRECAIRWGADAGLDMTGEPVSAREFRAAFRDNLDKILALDPAACSLTEGDSGDPGELDGESGTGVEVSKETDAKGENKTLNLNWTGVGALLAAVLVLFVAGVLICVYCRRRRAAVRPSGSRAESETGVSATDSKFDV